MFSEERFREIEEELLSRAEWYDDSHPNVEKARTLLIATTELRRIQNLVRENYPEEANSGRAYQDIFINKGVNSLFALHQVLKHRLYDAAYREIRYLFESYWVVKGLNRDQEEAARILNRQLEEIGELDPDLSEVERTMYEYESVDELHDILSDEKTRLKDSDPAYGRIYNFMSNRSTHPVRIEGSLLDGKGDLLEEEQCLRLGLVLLFGLMKELRKTYQGTSAEEKIVMESQPSIKQIEEVMPEEIPTFLLENYPE